MRRRPTGETTSRALLVLLVLALLLAGAGAAATAPGPLPAVRVPLAGIREHLAALQAIADGNGRTRLAGTPGYDASARYVARRLRAAGYRVRLQEFAIELALDRSPPSLRTTGPGGRSYRAGRDVATLRYSGSGRVEAPVVAVDLLVPSARANASTSGCEASDFRGFRRGAIALLQRGTCRFRRKVENAVAAGAAAVVVFNEGSDGRRGLFAGTLGSPQVAVPVLAASFGVGDELRGGVGNGPTGTTAALETDVLAERRTTRNVLAESPSGSPRNVVVVGAHLDSVERGPGINDNGSGSAVVLELAEQLAGRRTRNTVRFAWWGAEELGLLGSSWYVRRLTRAARERIALYLNVDMVGSRNFARFVYDGDGSASPRRPRPPAGSAAIERVLAGWFATRGLPYSETAVGASDHLPFRRAGIPVGGLFTGASGRKTPAQAADAGGRVGRPYDPCYHRACDTVANVGATPLREQANALAHAVALFAQDTSQVNGRR
jgi:Zn-dependent M28 family amino/carboxypeptidase